MSSFQQDSQPSASTTTTTTNSHTLPTLPKVLSSSDDVGSMGNEISAAGDRALAEMEERVKEK